MVIEWLLESLRNVILSQIEMEVFDQQFVIETSFKHYILEDVLKLTYKFTLWRSFTGLSWWWNCFDHRRWYLKLIYLDYVIKWDAVFRTLLVLWQWFESWLCQSVQMYLAGHALVSLSLHVFISNRFEDCRSAAERRLKAETFQECETEEERNQLQLLGHVQGIYNKLFNWVLVS